MATASKKPTEVKAEKTVTKKVAAPKAAATAEKKTVKTKASTPKTTATAKTATATKAAVKKPAKAAAPKKKVVAETAPAVSAEHRYHMIATAAYYIAEKRGSASGYEMQDWITAEAQIDLQLKSAK